MKNIIGFIVAGILGGLIVLGGLKYLDKPETSGVEIPQNVDIKNANYSPTSLPFDFVEAAERAMPCVVHIKAAESDSKVRQRFREYEQYRRRADPFELFFGNPIRRPRGKQQGFGSGVIISTDGYIVTNNHVIDFADEIEVTLHDNRKFKANLIGRDEKTDLALLKLKGDNFPAIELGNSDEVKVGQWVVAVGNPFNLTSTVTAGIVSAKGRSNIIATEDAIEDFIQTDAVVNSGNSGGALVDAAGKLIGINTAIATPDGVYAGYSFAIPSVLVSDIIKEIKENFDKHGSSYSTKTKGYLGASVEEIDEQLYRVYNLAKREGLIITEIENAGPAKLAGIRLKDIIIAINNTPVLTQRDMQNEMKKYGAGEKITFIINRDGDLYKVAVTLK